MPPFKLPQPIYLDAIYQAPEKPILLVVDTRVALYQLLPRSVALPKDFKRKILWEYYLNMLPAFIHSTLKDKKDIYLILVDDWRSKATYNYWREDWLRENASYAEEYKGNRGTRSEADRPDGYNILLEACHEYSKSAKIPLYRQEGFEADDIAGALFRAKASDNYQTILVTIDNDWMQLIDNSKDILMFVNGFFKAPISKLRSEFEVFSYYESREDVKMNSTYDIVTHKAEFGDAGDNIAAWSPREIIDLREPPVKPTVDFSTKWNYRVNANRGMKALQQLTQAEFGMR